MSKGLSKSRVIAWRQCPKRLWLQTYRPEAMEFASGAEQRFQAGHQIGDIAQQQFPDGILIDDEKLSDALESTRKAMADHAALPIFEATFQRDEVLVRADVLLPGRDGYRMIEVKSSTGVKDYHLEDCAIQTWVAQSAVSLATVELAHVDTGFVYPGGGDYAGLFNYVPVNDEIAPLIAAVPQWVSGAKQTLAGNEPEVATGKHCSTPFDCPFMGYCGVNVVTTDFPLSWLPRISEKRKEEFRAQGIVDIRDIPDNTELSDSQRWVTQVTKAGNAQLRTGAAQILQALPYPRFHLDFETVSLAAPIWAGTRPYQALPIQWSCHIETAPGVCKKHLAFLAPGFADSRAAFAEALIAAVAGEGPVLVYNQAFETRIMRELARDFPQFSGPLAQIIDRVIDLLPITRDHYYHPQMKGSWSIKAVLPAVAPELSYDTMDIGDGSQAEMAWREILTPATTELRRTELRDALSKYCALDTWAMVRLEWFLQGIQATAE